MDARDKGCTCKEWKKIGGDERGELQSKGHCPFCGRKFQQIRPTYHVTVEIRHQDGSEGKYLFTIDEFKKLLEKGYEDEYSWPLNNDNEIRDAEDAGSTVTEEKD